MNRYSQYGEENVIDSFFKGKKNGYVVDVGAADGKTNSNSRYLIESHEWNGLLVEPHPSYFKSLTDLYENNGKVKLRNVAVFNKAGILPFFEYGSDSEGQVSTLSPEFKNKVTNMHGNLYKDPINVNVVNLKDILIDSPHIDFLTIDCEGVDLEVIESNDWEKYRPSLLCIEHSMPKDILDALMAKYNYKLLTRTAGNSFFVE